MRRFIELVDCVPDGITTSDGKRYTETPAGRDYLTRNNIPRLSLEQMNLFTKESVMERDVEYFDPDEAIKALKENEGERILTIDLGGDKATRILWTIKDSILVPDLSTIETLKKENRGANYMLFFQHVAQEAEEEGLGVAISYAGPLEGTTPLDIPNAPDFMTALVTEYNGDFAQLFSSLQAANNDAQAGIKTAAIAVKRRLIEEGRLKPNGSIMFPINGGGFGLALLIDNHLRATEVGHVRIIDSLNPHGQTTPCGMLGRDHVCIEKVAASGAGIEPLWQKITGFALDGKEISQRYQNGDRNARELYETAALIFAHGIVGAANIGGLMQNPTDTAVVYHGGGFRVPGFKERIGQIIGKEKGFQPPTLFTDNISINACAEGAAIAAFCKSASRVPF